jgi:hypothetical protein
MSWLKARVKELVRADAMNEALMEPDPGFVPDELTLEQRIEAVAMEFAGRVVLESRRREGNGPAADIIAAADTDDDSGGKETP